MKQDETTTYPPLDNLEGRTVEQLLALRQQIREVRDQKRIATNEEITAEQTALRREGINQRRIFDIELNELKRQLDEIGDKMGTPAVRIKATDIREKMSELKYKFSMANLERDAKDARLATDRIRRNAQNQLDYENAEIAICKAIRAQNGFGQMDFRNQTSGHSAEYPADKQE